MLYALVFGAVADGARLSLARDALGSPTLRGEIFLGWADGFGRVAAARVRPVSRGRGRAWPCGAGTAGGGAEPIGGAGLTASRRVAAFLCPLDGNRDLSS